ncbi:MAG: hypothetical protein AAGB27_10090, partial [Pseudomonadota bacterium]
MSGLRNIFLIALGTCWCSAAIAITDVITSKSRFLTLTGASQVTEPYPSGNLGATSFESGSVTFTPVQGSGLNFAEWTTLFPGNDLALNGSTNLN